MSASIRLSPSSAIQLEPVQGTTVAPTAGVLWTIEGKHHGDVLNCALIPLDRIGAVIESLKLVAAQVRQ